MLSSLVAGDCSCKHKNKLISQLLWDSILNTFKRWLDTVIKTVCHIHRWNSPKYRHWGLQVGRGTRFWLPIFGVKFTSIVFCFFLWSWLNHVHSDPVLKSYFSPAQVRWQNGPWPLLMMSQAVQWTWISTGGPGMGHSGANGLTYLLPLDHHNPWTPLHYGKFLVLGTH